MGRKKSMAFVVYFAVDNIGWHLLSLSLKAEVLFSLNVTYICLLSGPSATCKTRCYTGGSQGDCYCDSACTYYGDCCADFTSLCTRPSGKFEVAKGICSP